MAEKNVVHELIEQGKAKGKLTTTEINDALEELNFDVEDVDKLYRRIGSLPVDGMYLDAAKVIKQKHIDEVITTRKVAASTAFKSVYMEAAKAGCEVKVYSDGALDRVFRWTAWW